MDMLSKILRPRSPRPPNERFVQDPSKSWPEAPPVDGKYYGVTGRHGEQMVAMTKHTWESLGTIIEQQRRTMVAQDDAIKKQSAHIQQLTVDLNDAVEKLNNLRGSHRELLKSNVERELGMEPEKLPGLNLFPTPKV